MQAGNGPVKIGKAYNIQRRLKEAQTFNSEKIHCIGYFPGNFKIEKYLHVIFKKSHIRGEWFKPHPELINMAKGIYDVKYEEVNGDKYLILYRDYINSSTDICPFCFTSHTHGEGDGHRIAHCLPYYGFNTIFSMDGTPLSRDSGYIIKSRSTEKFNLIFSKDIRPSVNRIAQYRYLINLAISQGIKNGVIDDEGNFKVPQGKRTTKWGENDGCLCKALYSDLGFNEIGVTILYGLNDQNWSPTTFPDYRDNKKCNAWASGIYNFKNRDVNYNMQHGNLKLYLSKNINRTY